MLCDSPLVMTLLKNVGKDRAKKALEELNTGGPMTETEKLMRLHTAGVISDEEYKNALEDMDKEGRI